MLDVRKPYRIGCDIGGTFTDFIILDERSGNVHLEKVLTTPEDPAAAVNDGWQRLAETIDGLQPSTRHIIHGTTLVINAVLQRTGVRAGLLATAGFRDVLEMRRYMRADMYDVFGGLPAPLISRELRLGVRERIFADGSVLTPLDEQSVIEAIDELVSRGVTSIAVCLMHAWVNDAHERRIAEMIFERYPKMVVSLSSDIMPKISEYERTSSTVVNAYVRPIVESYLNRLTGLMSERGFDCNLYLMLSGGGVTSIETAMRFPVRLVESGPVAGVLAARYYGALHNARSVLAFDMGGTTAKAALIQDGVIPIASDYEVDRANPLRKGSGIPLGLPAVDLIEVGTGGGSIAVIDDLGRVRVGPRSAGADPGPACYGRGGDEPTVTDADLVLGYLDPDYFLGGQIHLDRAAAVDAVRRHVADPLGTTVADAAWGIVNLAREQMATAIKMHVAEHGGDPGAITVVGFGGAGPVHAYGLARKLRAASILLPAGAGVMSALGMLMAPVAFDIVRSYRQRLTELDLPAIEQMFRTLEAEGREVLAAADPEGKPSFERTIDMRYAGQGYELTVPVPGGDLASLEPGMLAGLFSASYQQRYGYVADDTDIELIELRMRASVIGTPVTIRRLPENGTDTYAAVKGQRDAWEPELGRFVPHTVYDRYRLSPGMAFTGPAIVEERESTVVVGSLGTVRVDPWGSLQIEINYRATDMSDARDRPLVAV